MEEFFETLGNVCISNFADRIVSDDGRFNTHVIVYPTGCRMMQLVPYEIAHIHSLIEDFWCCYRVAPNAVARYCIAESFGPGDNPLGLQRIVYIARERGSDMQEIIQYFENRSQSVTLLTELENFG